MCFTDGKCSCNKRKGNSCYSQYICGAANPDLGGPANTAILVVFGAVGLCFMLACCYHSYQRNQKATSHDAELPGNNQYRLREAGCGFRPPDYVEPPAEYTKMEDKE